MASRALIVAIESYPNSAELAKQLPDVNKTALDFFDWLVSVRKIAAGWADEGVRFYAAPPTGSPAPPPGTPGNVGSLPLGPLTGRHSCQAAEIQRHAFHRGSN